MAQKNEKHYNASQCLLFIAASRKWYYSLRSVCLFLLRWQ